MSAQIRRRAERAGLALVPGVTEALGRYIGLLTKWNRRLNLTALELEPMADEAIDRLLIEPLVAARMLRPEDRVTVDVGSGGGSPGIPMKIAAPALRTVLVEVKARKCAFLKEAVRQLALEDMEVEATRVETLIRRDDLREATDLVTLRAVRADSELWRAVVALLRPGGRVFWFGADTGSADQSPDESLRVLPIRIPMPGTGVNHLAILEKLS